MLTNAVSISTPMNTKIQSMVMTGPGNPVKKKRIRRGVISRASSLAKDPVKAPKLSNLEEHSRLFVAKE